MSTARARFVALLRGINVGGCRIIRMADLRRVFEMAGCTMVGCTDVATYVQSGIVVFCSQQTKTPGLTGRIEKALSEAFRYASRVVVLSAGELGRVVAQAPRGFGKDVDPLPLRRSVSEASVDGAGDPRTGRRCGSGAWGVLCPSLAPYVPETRAHGADAAGGP